MRILLCISVSVTFLSLISSAYAQAQSGTSLSALSNLVAQQQVKISTLLDPSGNEAAPVLTSGGVTVRLGLFADPMRSQGLVSSTPCVGNHADSSFGAYGALCVNTGSNLTSGFGTYAGQVSLEVPADSQSTLSDQVGFFEGIHLNAFSANGWADNAQTTVEQDGPIAIIGEWDLTNKSGCDDVGAGGTTVPNAVPNRSDGSACPNKFGLVLTGVPYSGTAEAGIAFQYDGNVGRYMWQDAITFVGGYIARESDIYSNDLSYNPLWIKGIHGGSLLDLQNARAGFSGILLGEHNVTSDRILWYHDRGDTGTPDLGAWQIGPNAAAQMGATTGIGWQIGLPGGQAVVVDSVGDLFVPGNASATGTATAQNVVALGNASFGGALYWPAAGTCQPFFADDVSGNATVSEAPGHTCYLVWNVGGAVEASGSGSFRGTVSGSSVAVGTGGLTDAGSSVTSGSEIYGTGNAAGNHANTAETLSAYGSGVIALTPAGLPEGATSNIAVVTSGGLKLNADIMCQDGTDVASWSVKAFYLYKSGALTLLANTAPPDLPATSGATSWAIAVTADTTNSAPEIVVNVGTATATCSARTELLTVR